MTEKLSVDLHPIFRSDREIDRAVRNIVFRAVRERVPLAEIIVGKGNGKLQNRVLKMLRAPHLRKMCRSVQVDPGNEGRVLVRF